MSTFVLHNVSSFSYAYLRCPAGAGRRLKRAVAALEHLPREELSPVGALVEDNARYLQEEITALKENLRFAPRLPGERKTPRVLFLARSILSEGHGAVSSPLILRVTREFFSDEEPSPEELNLLCDALKCALLEKMQEIFLACEKEKENQTLALRWVARIEKGHTDALPRDPLLLEKIFSLLSLRENEEALKALRALPFGSGDAVMQIAQQEKTRLEEDARQCIASLRRLRHLPFSLLVERLNPVAHILREESTYRRMDEESRNYYIIQVCRLAKKMHVRPTAVARAAMALAVGEKGPQGESGYFLLKRPDLIEIYLLKRKKPSFFLDKRVWVYVSVLLLGAVFFLWLGIVLHLPGWIFPLWLLCGSEVTRLVLFPLLRRRFPARMLPRIGEKNLPKDLRVLIAVPTLLLSKKQALRLSHHLGVLKCASPRADILLLGDFADSDQEASPDDEEILAAAAAGIEALNDQYGGGFFLLQRKRQWDPGQQKFTGWERKRGALEEMNRLLTGKNSGESFLYCSCAPISLQNRYDYVITLDADTFLPAGVLEKLAGTMEHPLQKGVYSVLQPVMENAPDRVYTRTQRYLGGKGGADPYHLSRQDIYQDLFDRGSFVGKGIYDPRLWMERLEGKIPSGRILSHDLLEGELSRSALTDDLTLFDGHPAKLSGWQKRLHRWTRGDWQLLPFLFSPSLDLLSRCKIFDNLRRSLLAAGQVLLLILGAVLGNPFLCLLGLPWPVRGMGIRLMLLPGKAYTQLDAAIRALYRQFVSHHHLLSWVTAEQAESGSGLPLSCVMAQIICGAALTCFSLLPSGFLPAVWAGLLWLTGPLLIPYLDQKDRPQRPFTARQKQSVRDLARDTWRFFETSVSKDTHFLPPDNVQTEPDKGPALRTSPTNMGLYLLSCAAARKLNFISTAEMAERLENSLSTLEKMETWHGHFFNWYDLVSCQPLQPLFVSTVDSGNLSACLLCCGQICRTMLGDMEEKYRSLPVRLDALSRRMDFSRLYDREADLFAIGYDESQHRLSSAHYDLMASEARIASFVAVMQGQIPRKHWGRLNRTCIRAGGGAALLSWGGTAFEYLLPTLFLPLIPGTMLGEGCLCAVRAQMAAAGSRPFGISECGYYAFDPDLNYQYRAFGLPALSVSSEIKGNVTAPYASMLALPFFPYAAAVNLERMKKLGWADDCGLFEAADFSPQRVGPTPRLIQSHMAHHQGMILCAACNALTDFSLVRAFMAPPAAQACADLLWEKVPSFPRRQAVLPPPREDALSAQFPGRGAKKGFPLDAQALFGHGMTWVLSGQGSGYLSYNGMMITRFFDSASFPSGPQFYLRNRQTGEVIRPAFHENAHFENGCVRWTGEIWGIRYTQVCFITPLDGMAVTILILENPGKEGKNLEAVSFLEIAQSSQKADQAHPNFRDLSVQVQPWGERGLVSRRLPREANDETPCVYHTVTGDLAALRRQGDRRLFLGRNGSYALPEQLRSDAENAVFRTGDVIAPCLSLRALIRLRGRSKASVCFSTFASSDAIRPSDGEAAFEKMMGKLPLAATQYKMTLRFLHIDGDMLPCYQQMLGALVFSQQPHQSLSPTAGRNALWEIGVSGDLPVLLIEIGSVDRALIRHGLKAHAWMRSQGVWTDLIFFCPEEYEYVQPIHDALSQLIALNAGSELLGCSGGIHLISGDDGKLQRLQSLARLSLRWGVPLPKQLAALRSPAPSPSSLKMAHPSPVMPPPLQFFCGCGGFTQEGAYCVTFPAPAPWHHLLSGRCFGTLISEQGILQSFGENSYLHRITRPSPDVHRAMESEEILLRNEEGSVFPLSRCTAIFSPGIGEYHTLCDTVYSDLVLFSHPEKPFGIRHLTLRSEKRQKLRIYFRIRFALGTCPETTRCEAEEPFIFAQAGDFPFIGFAALENGTAQVCAGALYPDASLPGIISSGSGGNMGLFQADAVLKPHEAQSFTLILGWAETKEQAREHFYRAIEKGSSALERECRVFWQKRLSSLSLYAGSEALQYLLNGFLPYQAWASRLMSRTGPYQSGGAFGFRDQLQDLLAVVHTAPDYARAHILRCAGHQFREGDVQHWWHEPRKGVRTRICDDKLFLPYITARYVKITGDQSILQEEVPYLSSPLLGSNETERYEEPEISSLSEPLLLHCLRSIDSVALGSHDLPLMGGGDWNDGMNRIGGKRGESVWLGFFLALTLQEFSPLCEKEDQERLMVLRRKVLSAGESAWTGKWYLRAWRDSGEPIGGPDTQPPRIDLISQCFASLAGAPRDHAREAVYHAVKELYDPAAGIVKLLSPPFSPQENAGYIGAYLPGVRENGGQYTHAVPWLILALCQLGENDLAWEIAEAILPLSHGDTMEKINVYQLEPYVLAGDISAGENLGRGGWSWYTGSAAWLYYTFFTCLLGFDKQGEKARLSPHPRHGMEEYTIVYRHGASAYHFTAARDVIFPTLDGEKIQDGWVPLQDDGRTHEARYPLP